MAFLRENRVVPHGLPAPAGRARRGRRLGSPLGGPSARGARATPAVACARLAVGALVLALAACNPTIEGNGILYRDARSVDPFTGVEIEDGIDATITVGEAQGVTVVADANVVSVIETQVGTEPSLGQVLHVWIGTSERIEPTIPPSVEIQVPALDLVSARDGATAIVSRATADLLRVRGEADGYVKLNGPGGRALDAHLSASVLDAGPYPVAEGAYVELSAHARATVNVDGDVTGYVHETSTLDNERGTGMCLVEKDADSTVTCQSSALTTP